MEKNKYLKQAEEELKHLTGEPGIEDLIKRRADFLMDEDLEKALSYDEGKKEGLEQGIKQGIEQGIEQGTRERSKIIAKSMLEKQIDIKIIIECTGLKKEEIEELKR